MTSETKSLLEAVKNGPAGARYVRDYPNAIKKCDTVDGIWDFEICEIISEDGVIFPSVKLNLNRMSENGFRKTEKGWINP